MDAARLLNGHSADSLAKCISSRIAAQGDTAREHTIAETKSKIDRIWGGTAVRLLRGELLARARVC